MFANHGPIGLRIVNPATQAHQCKNADLGKSQANPWTVKFDISAFDVLTSFPIASSTVLALPLQSLLLAMPFASLLWIASECSSEDETPSEIRSS